MLSLIPEKSNLCQFWVSVTLKSFRISQNWPQKYLIWVENYWSIKFWAEQNSCEYIIVTQIWHVLLAPDHPKMRKLHKIQWHINSKSLMIESWNFQDFFVTERFISAKFHQNLRWSPWELRKYWMIWFGMTLLRFLKA